MQSSCGSTRLDWVSWSVRVHARYMFLWAICVCCVGTSREQDRRDTLDNNVQKRTNFFDLFLRSFSFVSTSTFITLFFFLQSFLSLLHRSFPLLILCIYFRFFFFFVRFLLNRVSERRTKFSVPFSGYYCVKYSHPSVFFQTYIFYWLLHVSFACKGVQGRWIISSITRRVNQRIYLAHSLTCFSFALVVMWYHLDDMSKICRPDK